MSESVAEIRQEQPLLRISDDADLEVPETQQRRQEGFRWKLVAVGVCVCFTVAAVLGVTKQGHAQIPPLATKAIIDRFFQLMTVEERFGNPAAQSDPDINSYWPGMTNPFREGNFPRAKCKLGITVRIENAGHLSGRKSNGFEATRLADVHGNPGLHGDSSPYVEWRLEDAGHGEVHIKNAQTGKFLEDHNGDVHLVAHPHGPPGGHRNSKWILQDEGCSDDIGDSMKDTEYVRQRWLNKFLPYELRRARCAKHPQDQQVRIVSGLGNLLILKWEVSEAEWYQSARGDVYVEKLGLSPGQRYPADTRWLITVPVADRVQVLDENGHFWGLYKLGANQCTPGAFSEHVTASSSKLLHGKHGLGDSDACGESHRITLPCQGCGPHWGDLGDCEQICLQDPACKFFTYFSDNGCRAYTACKDTVHVPGVRTSTYAVKLGSMGVGDYTDYTLFRDNHVCKSDAIIQTACHAGAAATDGCGPHWGNSLKCRKLCDANADCMFYVYFSDEGCRIYRDCVHSWSYDGVGTHVWAKSVTAAKQVQVRLAAFTSGRSTSWAKAGNTKATNTGATDALAMHDGVASSSGSHEYSTADTSDKDVKYLQRLLDDIK